IRVAPRQHQPSSIPMVTVEFAASLRRHVECAPQSVAPGTLRDVLEGALRAAPALANYVFDDQRAVRKHVAVFVNGHMVSDRVNLNQSLGAGDRVLVVQALTGG
ncbi:MAG: MoaD/ThiS family protein, partial [Rhodoferax sp.]|nr:MoaD/ThiS family protein [Rhodoferax sp.]